MNPTALAALYENMKKLSESTAVKINLASGTTSKAAYKVAYEVANQGLTLKTLEDMLSTLQQTIVLQDQEHYKMFNMTVIAPKKGTREDSAFKEEDRQLLKALVGKLAKTSDEITKVLVDKSISILVSEKDVMSYSTQIYCLELKGVQFLV